MSSRSEGVGESVVEYSSAASRRERPPRPIFTTEALSALVRAGRSPWPARRPEDPFAGLASPELIASRPLPGPSTRRAVDRAAPREPFRRRALAREKAALYFAGYPGCPQFEAAVSAGTTASTDWRCGRRPDFSGAYRATGHSNSASVIAGEGARLPAATAPGTGRATLKTSTPPRSERARLCSANGRFARLTPQEAEARRYPVQSDPRVAGTLRGHLHRGESPARRFARNVELPPGQARQLGVREGWFRIIDDQGGGASTAGIADRDSYDGEGPSG
jgi:hypothetical protein